MDCKKCGECCKTSYVMFSDQELKKIFKKYPSSRDRVNKTGDSCKNYGFRIVFWDGCPFLEDNECGIYDLRPIYCRMFPFIVDDSFVIRITSECTAFLTVNRKDYIKAYNSFEFLKGVIKSRIGAYANMHGFEKLNEQVEEFNKDLLEFSKRDTTKCLWFEATEFIQKKEEFEKHPELLDDVDEIYEKRVEKLGKIKAEKLKNDVKKYLDIDDMREPLV